MHVVSIYNNKGGVGKSTMTVGIAEFLASNRKKRVLVIDLDAQASSSGALLGRGALLSAIREERTIASLVGEIRKTRKVVSEPDRYLVKRDATEAKNSALAELTVLVPDRGGILELEESMNRARESQLLKKYFKPALESFDYVLIDMPGNVDRRNTLIVNGLTMSDFVVVPVEPPQIALNALPDTFELIRHAVSKNRNGRPAILGLVLNKTDKRAQQYKAKFPEILAAANRGELPPVFNAFLPTNPKLATATDETMFFETLKERFSTYYENVRKVARELERRCDEYADDQPSPTPESFAERFRRMVDRFAFAKRS